MKLLNLLFICSAIIYFSNGAFASDKHPKTSAFPEMIKIPSGQLKMFTCPVGTDICPEHSFVKRDVKISSFEISKTEVTMSQWDDCVNDGGCRNELSTWAHKNRPIHPPCVAGAVCQYPYDEGWGRSNRPVINVSWDDVQKYILWINKKTGKNYRLPTFEEWEYVAVAGSSTKYYWGNAIGTNNTNCNGCGSQWDGKQTAPVASFKPNQFGVYDMLGNVSEWVSTCLPLRKRGSQECRSYIYRGGAWSYNAERADPKSFDSFYSTLRAPYIGFRLAR